jgi:hypothetical protein
MIAVVCNLLTINVQVFLVYNNNDRYALHGIDVIKLQTTDSAKHVSGLKRAKFITFVRGSLMFEFECARVFTAP